MNKGTVKNKRINTNNGISKSNRTNTKLLITTSIVLSMFLVLSGTVSADEIPTMPNKFSGTVMLNGADASVGTAISAYIGGDLRGSVVVETTGEYVQLLVNGDEGAEITFVVCGATADQTAEWQEMSGPRILDLTATDNEAPAVSIPGANPPATDPDGAETSVLTVTVIDGCSCNIDSVTVNLSAIGGSDAQAMTPGGDVYSATVTVAEGTTPGTYCLQVNASDVFGNYDDTSVCISLDVNDIDAPEVTDPNANPATIVADGVETSQLNVTVVDDDSDIDFVTVNLSAIGGADAQAMSRVGTTDVYTVITNASESTTSGMYSLRVNASDVAGNYNDSVCVELEVTSAAGLIGDINGDTNVNIDDLILLGQAWGTYPGDSGYNAAADINNDGEIDIDDLILLGQNWTG